MNYKTFHYYDAIEDKGNQTTVFSIDPKEVKDLETLKELNRKRIVLSMLKDGKRKGENFVKSDVLCADIDNTDKENLLKLDDIKEIFKDYCFYIVSSKSHNKEKQGIVAERYHLFFPIENQIGDGDYLKRLLKTLVSKYHFFDTACADVARMYNQGSEDIAEYHEGDFIDYDLVMAMEPAKAGIRKENREHIRDDDLLKALKVLEEDGFFDDYETWLSLGMGLKSSGYAIEDWIALSWDKCDERDLNYKWNSFGDDGIAIGTLIHWAKTTGYKPHYEYEDIKEIDEDFIKRKYPHLKINLNEPFIFEKIEDEKDPNNNKDDFSILMDFFNTYFIKAISGGKAVIIDKEDFRKALDKSNFLQAFSNKKYREKVIQSNGKTTEKDHNAAALWFDCVPIFDKVGFFPYGYNSKPKEAKYRYNYFVPFIEPNEKDYEEYGKEFIEKVIKDAICGNDEKKFQYLIQWIAQIYYKPEDKQKAGISITIRGKTGTGKSCFGDVLKTLFNQNQSVSISRSESITGTFNSILADKVLVIGEEAVWGGDKKESGKFKNLITNSTINLRFMYRDEIIVPNYVRLLQLTNEEYVLSSKNERRMIVFDMNENYRKNTKLFSMIYKNMGAVARGLAFYLTEKYNADFDFQKNFFLTEGVIESIQRGADIVESFIENELLPMFETSEDDVIEEEMNLEKDPERFMAYTDDLYDRYIEYSNKMRNNYPSNKIVFSKKMMKVFPSCEIKKKGKRGEQKKVFIFYNYEMMRKDFDDFMYSKED